MMKMRTVRLRVQMKGTTAFVALGAVVDLAVVESVRFLHSLRSVGMTVVGGRSVGMTGMEDARSE